MENEYKILIGTLEVSWTTDARFPAGKRSVFMPPLWGSPTLLSNGYRALFSLEKRDRNVKLTTRLHLIPRLRMCGAVPPLLIRLHVVVIS
jgi:hypothetical protein